MRFGREVVRWPLSIHVLDAMKLFVGLNLLDLQTQQRRVLLPPAQLSPGSALFEVISNHVSKFVACVLR